LPIDRYHEARRDPALQKHRKARVGGNDPDVSSKPHALEGGLQGRSCRRDDPPTRDGPRLGAFSNLHHVYEDVVHPAATKGSLRREVGKGLVYPNFRRVL
jgi:hypothetical protein